MEHESLGNSVLHFARPKPREICVCATLRTLGFTQVACGGWPQKTKHSLLFQAPSKDACENLCSPTPSNFLSGTSLAEHFLNGTSVGGPLGGAHTFSTFTSTFTTRTPTMIGPVRKPPAAKLAPQPKTSASVASSFNGNQKGHDRQSA